MMLRQIKYVVERPGPQQGDRPTDTHQDNTPGSEWITRLERPERIPGLKIADVVNCLRLKPGDVVADIGAGTGVFTIPFAKAVAPFGRLPANQVDLVFFHDVFHNINDRQAYLGQLATTLKPTGRIAIIEQDFDDPIAKKWDLAEDRITREQVAV